jgi:hypothetical protein
LEGFPRWWAQWVRWSSQPAVRVGASGAAHVLGDEVWVQVSAREDDASPDSARVLEASLRSTDGAGETERVVAGAPVRPLIETAPGRYEARLPITPGTWEVVVSDVDDGREVVVLPVEHAYAARFSVSTGRAEAVARIARA